MPTVFKLSISTFMDTILLNICILRNRLAIKNNFKNILLNTCVVLDKCLPLLNN